MTPLRQALPADLYWLTERVQALVKPAAFFSPDPARVSPLGGTRAWGPPDLPSDAPGADAARKADANSSPEDGPAFSLQLNLQDIPAQVRNPAWPAFGVVWVFVDWRPGQWRTTVEFDARPASDIPWLPRTLSGPTVPAADWSLQESLPWCTPLTLPDVWDGPSQHCDAYDEWMREHYRDRQCGDCFVGGWVLPVQGDMDDNNEDFVCALENRSFGDAGAVYLHYTPAGGFYGMAETH